MDAFRSFYAPIADMIEPGLDLEQFLKAGCRLELWVIGGNSCSHADNCCNWIDRRIEEHRTMTAIDTDLTLRTGQKLVMSKRRVSNGNIITTLIDVTAQREREEELRRTRDALEHIAYFDALTTLPNRAHGQQDLEALMRPEEASDGFALIQIDLDKFKRINDTLGHAAGDHLLKVTGSRLAFLSSKVPAFKPYRWGGDEFVAIVKLGKGLDLDDLCQELTDLIAVPVSYQSTTLWPTTSIGVASYPSDATDLESLMIYADLALYKTKEMGRDGYQFFSAEMKEKIDGDNKIEHGVRSALKLDEFEVFFQQQVSTFDETIVGIECLVRLEPP